MPDFHRFRCEYFGEAGEPNADGQTCDRTVTKVVTLKINGEEVGLMSCTEHERDFAQEPDYINTSDYDEMRDRGLDALRGARFRFVGNIAIRDERPPVHDLSTPRCIDADVVGEEGEA
jgi:hypothetical protein